MVNLIQVVGLFFFSMSALEFWGWRGAPETPWAYAYLLACMICFGLAEVIRRLPDKSQTSIHGASS